MLIGRILKFVQIKFHFGPKNLKNKKYEMKNDNDEIKYEMKNEMKNNITSNTGNDKCNAIK